MLKLNSTQASADVCLLLEGTYPYVSGGVSSWTHDLLRAQRDLKFHLVSLLPLGADLNRRYEVPANVISCSNVFIQEVFSGGAAVKNADAFLKRLEAPLTRLQKRGGLPELSEILEVFHSVPGKLGKHLMLNSPPAWRMLLRMYESGLENNSFLDYFWSWRALLGGLYSILQAEIPPARVYHAISTGYAGLLAARAHLETGRPALVTEHGIYTNERRIEMAMANWLHDPGSDVLHISERPRTLKDVWVDTFVAYSRVCYEAASEVITLYAGNQQFQLQDGASPDKLRIIPNGIDYERYSAIEREHGERLPTVALIGRVVPIKDIKTFIRSIALLRGMLGLVRGLIIGPMDEDKEYFEECRKLVAHLGLQETIEFTGRVKIDDYLGKIDVLVLTSISEAQPLVILEAGAAGVPAVATDVGACREMILGSPAEEPPLGAGGAVTPLSNPAATAQEAAKLLGDPDWAARAGRALKERARLYYNKLAVDETYRALYEKYRTLPDAGPAAMKGNRAWPA